MMSHLEFRMICVIYRSFSIGHISTFKTQAIIKEDTHDSIIGHSSYLLVRHTKSHRYSIHLPHDHRSLYQPRLPGRRNLGFHKSCEVKKLANHQIHPDLHLRTAPRVRNLKFSGRHFHPIGDSIISDSHNILIQIVPYFYSDSPIF